MRMTPYFLIFLSLFSVYATGQQLTPAQQQEWPATILGKHFSPDSFPGAINIPRGEQNFSTRIGIQKIFYTTNKLNKAFLNIPVESVGFALTSDSIVHSVTYFIPFTAATYHKILEDLGETTISSEAAPFSINEIHTWKRDGYSLSLRRIEELQNHILISYTLPFMFIEEPVKE